MSLRAQLLDKAKKYITQDRNNTYGPPHQDFQRVADMMTSLGFRGPGGGPVQAHHFAMVMVCLKLSRLVWSPLHDDNWVDMAGYAGCGGEAAHLTLNPPSAEPEANAA